MNIPSIYIDENPKAEVEIFYKSLHNNFYPWMRPMIYNHPGLKPLESLLSKEGMTKKEEKQIIGEFFVNLRDKYRNKIDPFLDHCRERLAEDSKGALVTLAQLMDYEWLEKTSDYRAIPVLLPFSPFGKNIFFYSIYAVIREDNPKDILDTAIHEISHMILFDLLEKYHPEFQEYSLTVDYLKEILAPILIDQPPLKKYMNLSQYPKGYVGNTELEEIYVSANNTGRVQISRFYQKGYEEMRYQEHKPFREIVDAMIRLLKSAEQELAKKRDMWNKHQFEIFQSEELLGEYSKPIVLNESSTSLRW